MLSVQGMSLLARAQLCSRALGSLIPQGCSALLQQAVACAEEASFQLYTPGSTRRAHGSAGVAWGRSMPTQHAMHSSLLLEGMARSFSSSAEASESGSQSQASTSKSKGTSASSNLDYLKQVHILKITSPLRNGLQNVLITDVLNMLEDPNLLELDVKIAYDMLHWAPKAYYVLYQHRAMRDAALQIAGSNGKAQIGTVPVTLEVGKAREVQEAHDKSRMLASSNRHASSKRGSIHHHGRVVLMTTEEPIQVDQVTDKLFAGFDLVHPRVIPFRYNPQIDTVYSNLKQKRALVFFANPDEASRAVRTCHNSKLVDKPVQLRVIQ